MTEQQLLAVPAQLEPLKGITMSESYSSEIRFQMPVEYQWIYLLLDTSRVFTYVFAIMLIVYGSFRSLKIDQDARNEEKLNGATTANNQNGQGFHMLETSHVILLPIGASVSLLIMFFFFDSLQMVFALCTAFIAAVAFAFVLLPVCQYVMTPTCSDGKKMSFGALGRYTAPEILSFSLSSGLVCLWVLTGHWLLMDALGMGLCIAFIALVRLPSLKVSTLLLSGLLLYDVFWVFFSSYIFKTNVMVKVATRSADNPVNIVSMMARKLHLHIVMKDPPKLSLPGKLVFPSLYRTGHFSMLGLGDIVMPGLLLCFVLRYDAYKRQQYADAGLTPPVYLQRLTYFHCSLMGYFLGLLTATVSSEVFKAAQPALLYLVPFTLLPLMLMAYLKGDLRRMWSEPFITPTVSKQQEV